MNSVNTAIRIADSVIVKRLTLEEAFNGAIKVLAPIAGVAIFAMVVWAGFLFITSQGQPDKLQIARRAITYAILGIIVVALSALIVLYIISNLKG